MRPELPNLSALGLEKLVYLTAYMLASTNINQSVPNLVKMCTTIQSRIASIMGLIRIEGLELPAPEIKVLLYLTVLAYTLASTKC